MRFKKALLLLIFLLLIFSNPEMVGEDEEIILTKKRRVKIPAIYLDEEICKLEREICLDYGIWMKYFDKRGNILLTGHSFTILPFGAGVFYALSDLKIGDIIYIKYEKNLVYIVEDILIVSRYDLEIENFEKLENTLVLYSCFPLWSASERIVVRATLCNLCEYEL